MVQYNHTNMHMTLNELFDTLQIDKDVLQNRFCNNISLLEKFIRKFLTDTTFANLRAAYEADDYENMHMYAHTLKGISANLEFTTLFASCSAMVNDIRANKYECMQADFESVEKNYESIIDAIKRLD